MAKGRPDPRFGPEWPKSSVFGQKRPKNPKNPDLGKNAQIWLSRGRFSGMPGPAPCEKKKKARILVMEKGWPPPRRGGPPPRGGSPPLGGGYPPRHLYI